MAFPTLGVKNGAGSDATINTLPNAGQALAADSLPVVLPALQAAALAAPVLAAGTADVGKVDASGTKVTAATIPTGGVGFLGWLSAVWYQLTQILTVKVDQTTPGTTNAVQPVPGTTNGLSAFKSLDLDETEEDVKTSAGMVYGWYLFNAAASTRYVKFYNATAANTTVGTTTPAITVPLPAGQGANVAFEHGIAFSTAICVAATTGLADNDTGAPTTSDVVANVFYK